jgi:hypothetical protein
VPDHASALPLPEAAGPSEEPQIRWTGKAQPKRPREEPTGAGTGVSRRRIRPSSQLGGAASDAEPEFSVSSVVYEAGSTTWPGCDAADVATAARPVLPLRSPATTHGSPLASPRGARPRGGNCAVTTPAERFLAALAAQPAVMVTPTGSDRASSSAPVVGAGSEAVVVSAVVKELASKARVSRARAQPDGLPSTVLRLLRAEGAAPKPVLRVLYGAVVKHVKPLGLPNAQALVSMVLEATGRPLAAVPASGKPHSHNAITGDDIAAVLMGACMHAELAGAVEAAVASFRNVEAASSEGSDVCGSAAAWQGGLRPHEGL